MMRAAVEDALWRLGRLMYERSPAMADEFVADGLLVGSEPGEIARGREAIRALLAGFHELPARYTWQWDSVDIVVEGDLAWLFAEGLSVRELDGTQTRPYRLSGVLQAAGGMWRWRQFHGSEPRV